MNPLERLLATEEIRTLRIKYAHLLDSNHIDRLDEVFSSDAIVDAGRGQWEGWMPSFPVSARPTRLTTEPVTVSTRSITRS